MFINLEAQKEFHDNFEPFINQLETLKSTIDVALSSATHDPVDFKQEVVYFLFRVICDDFFEVCLLAANGYSSGAMKILRAMFESAVHIRYFQKYPESIELFWDYAWIDERKIINSLVSDHPNIRTKNFIENVKENAEKVKDKYQVPVCDKCKKEDCAECKKTRTSHAWFGKRDLLSMAKDINFTSYLIWKAYYEPLQETHPKLHSMIRRTTYNEKGEFEYDDKPNHVQNFETLYVAHLLLLTSFEAFINYFELMSLSTELQTLFKNHAEIWGKLLDKFKAERDELL